MNEKTNFGLIVKWKFFTALFIGFLLLGILVATFGVTSTAFGLPLGGMGDFYVAFDRLEGTGFFLDSNLGERGKSKPDQIPLVRNEIEGATVYGLHIYKDIHIPFIGWIRLNMKSSEPTKIKGLIQEARFIKADVNFVNLGITRTDISKWTVGESIWPHNADVVSITDGKIVTDYLFQDLVTLTGMTFTVEQIDSPEQHDG